MCLGIPAKIVSITGDFAQVSIQGARIEVGIQLLDSVSVGDYVLVHTGYALEILSEEDALETLEAIRLLEKLNLGKLPSLS